MVRRRPVSSGSVAGASAALVLAATAAAQGPGLSPAGTHAVVATTANDYTTVHGVVVDVKVYRPVGLPAGSASPVVLYSPGGGSGTTGTIPTPSQYETLWQRLASCGATVIYLQNGAESAPGINFWRLRGDVVLWALGHFAGFNQSFGTQLGPTSPVVVAGWSLGAATGSQHVGANYGFGNYADPRVRGAVLFASPALGAYAGAISAAGLAQIDDPVLCIFGTEDMGQPGTYLPGQAPATTPRGLAVEAMLQGPSRLVVVACFRDTNHFGYGAQPAAPGSPAAQRIAFIDALVERFVDVVLRGLPDCGAFGDGAWADPAFVAWSTTRCLVPRVTFAGSGCPTSSGVPAIGTAGGDPYAGNANFALTLGDSPPGALYVTAVQVGGTLQVPGAPIPDAPACAAAFVAPGLLWSGLADATGSAAIPVPLVPAGSALLGLTLAVQHAVFDFANPAFAGLALPLGTSVGMQIVVGW